MRIGLIFIFICCFFYSSSAQDNEIDQFLIKCKQSYDARTESGLMGCISIATEKWEGELLKNYNKLYEILDDKTRNVLKQNQHDWEKYRDQMFKFLEDMYGSRHNSVFVSMIAEDKMNVIKARAVFLKSYYEKIEMIK